MAGAVTFTASTCFFDGRDRRLGCSGQLNRQGLLDAASPKKSHAVQLAPDNALLHQEVLCDRCRAIDLAGRNRFGEGIHIDLGELEPPGLVEAALRDPHVKRHLATFEPVDRNTRPGFLALHAAPAGLALARADPASDTHRRLARAVFVRQLIQPHSDDSLSLT